MRLVESKKPEAASNISPQNHHHPFPSIKVGLPSPHRSSNEHVQRRLGRKVEPGGSERELRYNLHCAACQSVKTLHYTAQTLAMPWQFFPKD